MIKFHQQLLVLMYKDLVVVPEDMEVGEVLESTLMKVSI
jgi:hypothetical protein